MTVSDPTFILAAWPFEALLTYTGFRKAGSSVSPLLPVLDFGRVLPLIADAGIVGGPMTPLRGRLLDLVLLLPGDPGVSRRSNGSSRRGGRSLAVKAVGVLRRADSEGSAAASWDTDAAESGLRELADEPGWKKDAVDGRRPPASFR